jgi:prefoldin subunit 5
MSYRKSDAVSPDELREKITEYADFLEQRLYPELKLAVERREETEFEISEYEQLRLNLKELLDVPQQQPLESVVDLTGHGAAYARAIVPVDQTNTVFVDIGIGFHAELSLSEAIDFIGKRVEFLTKTRLQQRLDKAKTVADDVKNAMAILDEIGKEADDR